MLVPELVVQRGSTYTFIVEGGDNANSLMVYHPFYLTDSITGGKLRGMFPGVSLYGYASAYLSMHHNIFMSTFMIDV